MRPIIRGSTRLWLIAGIILISLSPLLPTGWGRPRPSLGSYQCVTHRPIGKFRRLAHLVSRLPSYIRTIGIEPEDEGEQRLRNRRQGDGSPLADDGLLIARSSFLSNVPSFSHGARLMRC